MFKLKYRWKKVFQGMILKIVSMAKWSDGYSLDGRPVEPMSSLLGSFKIAIGTKPSGL